MEAHSELCALTDSLLVDEHEVLFVHLQQEHHLVQRAAVLRFDVERSPLVDDMGYHALVWGPAPPVGLADLSFPAVVGPLEPV